MNTSTIILISVVCALIAISLGFFFYLTYFFLINQRDWNAFKESTNNKLDSIAQKIIERTREDLDVKFKGYQNNLDRSVMESFAEQNNQYTKLYNKNMDFTKSIGDGVEREFQGVYGNIQKLRGKIDTIDKKTANTFIDVYKKTDTLEKEIKSFRQQ